uniref:Tyrosine--tRNA ligase n=1 Tax=Strigamia maritima TaxID=126957 RepID=T1IWP7_STRMM
MSANFLYLSPDPIRFEPVSNLTNVFFDDANLQVFTVRSGGATGVVVKGPDEKTLKNFRMEDKGTVISIKFSLDQKILAVQRSQSSIEFVNFLTDIDTAEYSQSCKGKNTKIRGFNWTFQNEITVITDHGIELYQVVPEKRILKTLKTYSQTVHWFVYLTKSALLLTVSGSLCNQMQPYQFKAGNVYKLPKFEVDLPVNSKPPKQPLLERDVILAEIYGAIRIVVLRHQPKGPGNARAEIAVYTFQKEGPARKTDILKLNMSGRFAMNTIDNLLVVHHQASKTSMIFDIRLTGESDGYLNYHDPVTAPLPIQPFKLKVPVVPCQGQKEPAQISCELYSPNWIAFQPNVIIDAKLGCLWYIHLHVDSLVDMIPDKNQLVEFLLLRNESKHLLLNVCRQAVSPGFQLSLYVLSQIFNQLNQVYRKHLEADIQAQAQNGSRVIIEQSDMYTHVFSLFLEDKDLNYKFVVAVLLEYIRSLNYFDIPVQHYLYEPVINTLVSHKNFYQLHQFLQYHVLSDSKPLACLLLSLESAYPPAFQLALDMLKRLTTANEEIVEVLLSKQQILTALRFISGTLNAESISSRKFLEAAMNTNDSLVFYAVFKFLEQRNLRLRGSPVFVKGEHCDVYIQHFKSLFKTESSLSNPKFSEILSNNSSAVYAGFDPTADSLHVGNLLVVMAMLHCQRAKHQLIAVMGCATAQLGDPTGRKYDRPTLDPNVVQANAKSIENCLRRIFANHQNLYNQENCRQELPPVMLVFGVGLRWYNRFNLIHFLTDIGRHFRLGTMLQKRSVQSRLLGEGINFKEFAYQVFQAYDWLHLFQKHNCVLQLGGVDQLGNIHAGHQLITQIENKPFFLRIKDSEVEKYLKLYTFLPLAEIADIMERSRKHPEPRFAQNILASTVTQLVHGEEGLNSAKRVTNALYSNAPEALFNLGEKEMQQVFQEAQTAQLLHKSGMTVLDMAMKAGCFSNEVDARRIIEAGGFYVNHRRVIHHEYFLVPGEHILPNNLTLLRCGKKNYYVVRWL